MWIKFRRLMQNDMSTAVIWSKSKPDVEFQYDGHVGEFHGMSSQSHVSHCSHATLQGAVTWRNQCHDRATLQGVIIPSAIMKIVFRHILLFFVFNAVCALTSGGFRIVSDTLVILATPGINLLHNHSSASSFAYVLELDLHLQ